MAALVESMFSVKEEPWHKQGTILDDHPDTDEAYVASGLNWDVIKAPMFYRFGDNEVSSQDVALIRSTDGSQLGTCRDRYQIFQNIDGFEWCRPLVESGFWKYETAGALKNGQVGWILLNQGETEIVDKDKLKQYLLLTWAHDGKTSVQPMTTSIRVVCNNTLTAALNTAEDRRYVLHNSRMHTNLEAIRSMYYNTKEQFERQEEAFKKMLDVEMTEGQINTFVDNLLLNAFGVKEIPREFIDTNDTVDLDLSVRAKNNILRTRKTLLDGAFNGTGTHALGIDNTLYAVFNGIEEAVEHSLGGKRVKDRGMNILFGNGRNIVDTAYNQAMALVG